MTRTDKPILYVDDTVEQRYAMRRILEREGYRVIEVGTGADALAQVTPELLAIILDVKLPDMSGYDVCRQIKADAVVRSIPVIQVSASFADPDLRSEGLSGGADAYIAQPVHPPELINLVKSLIRSQQSERMIGFLAHAGLQITRSLDLAETLAAVQSAVVPHFADRCLLQIDHLTEELAEKEEIDPRLQLLEHQVRAGGTAMFLQPREVARSVIGAPVRTGSRQLGTVLFELHGSHRVYNSPDLAFAEGLADRIALAVQNAQLHTAQQTAQDALVQSEKLAAAGRLSAAIAHELNNPLESITNLIYLIETSPEASDSIRDYARDALSEITRLSHITRQSLGFYRELTTAQDFDLSASLDETVELYRRRFDAKHITIMCTLEPSLCIHGVKGEIRQVFSNLLVNALDALSVNGSLRVEAVRLGGEAAVTIADDGTGIPAENLTRIFEPFFTTKPGTGTGLGLWVSSTIIEKHDGRLEVRTETEGEQHGTAFTVTLPALAARR